MPVSSWSTTASSNATADNASGISWSEGQPPSSLNDSARAMMAEIKKWYDSGKAGFRAHKNNVDQTGIASGTLTKITFTTEVFDTGSYYDAANSKWTPPAGPVIINASMIISAGLVDQTTIRAYIYKNGSPVQYEQASLSGANAISASVTLVDNANGTDYYEAYFFGATGATMAVAGSTQLSYFQGASL